MSEHEVNEMLDWHDKDEGFDAANLTWTSSTTIHVEGYTIYNGNTGEIYETWIEEGCDHYPYSCQGCGGCDKEEEDEDI